LEFVIAVLRQDDFCNLLIVKCLVAKEAVAKHFDRITENSGFRFSLVSSPGFPRCAMGALLGAVAPIGHHFLKKGDGNRITLSPIFIN
jgi:hypothetical protein